MFHKNDKVVYANYGACTVSETDASMTMGGIERSYYVLLPLRKRGGTVYVPVDHEELIRPVIGRSSRITTKSSRIPSPTAIPTASKSTSSGCCAAAIAQRPCASRKPCRCGSRSRKASAIFPRRCTPACSTRQDTRRQASFPPRSKWPKKSLSHSSKTAAGRPHPRDANRRQAGRPVRQEPAAQIDRLQDRKPQAMRP